MSVSTSLQHYFSLIKISHTVFALPFALLGFFFGFAELDRQFNGWVLFLVLLCMFFARSAAMAFNRYADRFIDGRNPRTAVREIPSGTISPDFVLFLVILNCLGFILACWFINPLCFYLSPVALLVVLGYSYTKRFTSFCHLVLGIGLGLAPVGAYIAMTGEFAMVSVLYGFGVLFWVAGFDVIYALQDERFDRKHNLFSIPVMAGKGGGLLISRIMHLISATIFSAATYILIESYSLGFGIALTGLIIFLLLLVFQHSLVRKDDLSRVNLAFFTTNGVASFVLAGFLIAAILAG